MAVLTTRQLLLVGAIGGAAFAATLIVIVVLAVAAHAAVGRFADRAEARRTRRQHLKTCRAIDALGTTTQPKD